MGESGSLVRACCFHKNLLEQTTAQAQGSSHPCAPVRGRGRGKGGGGGGHVAVRCSQFFWVQLPSQRDLERSLTVRHPRFKFWPSYLPALRPPASYVTSIDLSFPPRSFLRGSGVYVIRYCTQSIEQSAWNIVGSETLCSLSSGVCCNPRVLISLFMPQVLTPCLCQ